MSRIDPITLEVIRHASIAAAEEMKTNLMRTAHNPIIYEVLDFSCGIFDHRCNMIAQADGLPGFLGNLAAAIRVVVDDIGIENFRPGDLYLINDPYETGVHVNDVTTVNPVFDDDGEIIAFTSARAHWLDIGAKDPGGSIDSTDIVQEGLWFRSVRLYEEGELNESIWRIIQYNVRYTRAMLGDLQAQVAASRTGEKRIQEIFRRHGRATVRAALDELLRQGEQRARTAIRAMKDGVYEAESRLDDDCLGNGPLEVKVKAIVDGDTLTIDLTGSHAQNVGPVNCGLPATLSGCRVALKSLTAPHAPVTEGDFAPLELIVPEKNMFNAAYPAPTFMYGTHLILLGDTVMKALSKALPDTVIAAHYGNLAGCMFFGTDPRTGQLYIHQEPENGGWGAGPHGDGESALIFSLDGDTRNIPAEVIENRFPLRMERHELRQDSGGPGKNRGGLGILREYRILGHEARMMCIMDRKVDPPWGLWDGKAAAHCRTVVNPGTDREVVHQKIMGELVRDGDLISVQTGGGGGWGDPLERDPEKVQRDVRAGYISFAAAKKEYGVVLDRETLEIDREATEKLRPLRTTVT